MLVKDINQLEALLKDKVQKEKQNSSVEKIYGYYTTEFSEARKKLRKFLRLMHGYDENEDCGIGVARPNSPLMKLKEGAKVWVSNENIITVLKDGQGALETKGILIDGADIERQQKEVEILFDDKKITAEQVYHIQLFKAGRESEIELSDGKILHDYALDLEQLGSYVVVRGKVWQSHEYNGNTCSEPKERVLYYANFPKLQGDEGRDINYFCEKRDGAFYLKESLKAELKEKFKAVIRLQARMAAKHGEALDIVTPRAFFYGLEEKEREKAREWFLEAVIEFGQEDSIKGFVGLFIHDKLPEAKEPYKFKTPILVNPGNAASPGRLANENKYGFMVADCIMGEACGHAGNGALGDRADLAKEENDARVMSLMQLIFGPQFNEFLMGEVRKLASVTKEQEEKRREEKRREEIKQEEIRREELYTTCLYGLAAVVVLGAAVALNIAGLRDVCNKLIASLFSANEGRSIGS